MSEKLLPSPLTNTQSSSARRMRLAAVVVGAFVVLWGAADLTARIANATLGADAGLMVFGPAVALNNPSVLSGLLGNTTASSSLSAQAGDSFIPTQLKIPSIGVDAHVEQTGQKADGTMATPTNFDDVAWYALGGHPGGAGNAVFAGHVNNALTKAGVFAHLDQVHLGDYITVSDADGHTLVYKVKAINEYPANHAPADSIFAAGGPSQLVLITCDGDWVQAQKTFDKRLVVEAIPVYTGFVR